MGVDVTESKDEGGHHEGTSHNALPRIVHITVPIIAALVLLVFGATVLLPANKAAFPEQTTLFFVPLYLVVVVGVVFSCLYLFKTFFEKEVRTTDH